MSLNFITKMLVLLLLPLLFTAVSCNKPTEPPPNNDDKPIVKNTIVLKTEWQDLNRICLKFNKTVADTASLYKYTIKRKRDLGEEETISSFNIYGNDTLYIDGAVDTLETGKTFTYRITATDKEENLKDTSNTITTATLSPTSHEFEWTIDTLGVPGNAGLFDIWGTDENNVFAIGGVTLPDGGSSVIKWDGEKWSPVRNVEPLIKYGIYGFSINNIWIVGNGNFHYGGAMFYSGSTSVTYYFDPSNPKYRDTIYALNAVWGASPNDVWAVGGSGTIIHWDGVEWKKVESPTRMYLIDIWGNASDNVFAVGATLTGQYELLHFGGESWKLISNQIPFGLWMFRSIWIDKSGKGIIVGNKGIQYDGVNWNLIQDNRFVRLQIVRGSGNNNIFTGGQYGNLLHYNGKEWKKFNELEDLNNFSTMQCIIVFENSVIIGGYNFNGVLVWHGRRRN